MTGTGRSFCRIAMQLGYWTRGQMSDGCSVVRFLCTRDFAPLELQHQSKCTENVGVVYGAVSPAAAGRVECRHSHHGWLSKNVGFVERAVLYRGASSREGRLVDVLLSGIIYSVSLHSSCPLFIKSVSLHLHITPLILGKFLENRSSESHILCKGMVENMPVSRECCVRF